jgi:type II secretory pathway component PulC
MVNKVLSWSKENYEKLILGLTSILLIMAILSFLMSGNKRKGLEDFGKTIQPPLTPPLTRESTIDIENAESYIKENPMSYYQPISDRAVFFPAEVKKPDVVTAPQMSLGCTGIISTAEGVLVATLKNSRTGNIYNVKEGEQAENFIVVSITRDVVVLSGEGGQHRLKPPVVQMSFKLTGIMPTETGAKEAMLQNEVTKKTYFLKKGDKMENWDVLNISENAVIIFRQDAGKYELKIGGEFQRVQE